LSENDEKECSLSNLKKTGNKKQIRSTEKNTEDILIMPTYDGIRKKGLYNLSIKQDFTFFNLFLP